MHMKWEVLRTRRQQAFAALRSAFDCMEDAHGRVDAHRHRLKDCEILSDEWHKLHAELETLNADWGSAATHFNHAMNELTKIHAEVLDETCLGSSLTRRPTTIDR